MRYFKQTTVKTRQLGKTKVIWRFALELFTFKEPTTTLIYQDSENKGEIMLFYSLSIFIHIYLHIYSHTHMHEYYTNYMWYKNILVSSRNTQSTYPSLSDDFMRSIRKETYIQKVQLNSRLTCSISILLSRHLSGSCYYPHIKMDGILWSNGIPLLID